MKVAADSKSWNLNLTAIRNDARRVAIRKRLPAAKRAAGVLVVAAMEALLEGGHDNLTPSQLAMIIGQCAIYEVSGAVARQNRLSTRRGKANDA